MYYLHYKQDKLCFTLFHTTYRFLLENLAKI